jgi:Co/Zn/Cd efflux system component
MMPSKEKTMSAHCHHDHSAASGESHNHSHGHDHDHLPAGDDSPQYRRVLWIALIVNLAMFAVEMGAGWRSGSVSLLADAIDFLGDGLNYGVSLAVLSMGLALRARAAWLKGASMLAFGVFVAGRALWMLWQGDVPQPLAMGVVGLLALAANLGVAALLYAWRNGDANMRSVWLCTRNDAIGNLAVLLAALGVFGTAAAWPDLLVAGVMAALAISSGWSVLRHAARELAWNRGR